MKKLIFIKKEFQVDVYNYKLSKLGHISKFKNNYDFVAMKGKYIPIERLNEIYKIFKENKTKWDLNSRL